MQLQLEGICRRGAVEEARRYKHHSLLHCSTASAHPALHGKKCPGLVVHKLFQEF